MPEAAPSLSAEDLAAKASQVLMPNYGARQLAIVRGEGSRCWDAEGREYLDFLSGIAVNNVGHRHPAVLEAIAAQSAELLHCSNAFIIEPQVLLAERLVREAGMDKAIFSNSGTEATEAAIKLARLRARNRRGPGHSTIMVFENSFHGRTYGAMSGTWSAKVRTGFDPLVPGFVFAKLNDLASVDAAWDDTVCGVLVETIQGEGGVVPCEAEFLHGLRERCTRADATLITDEIQCGMGRSGRAFAFQHSGVIPDVVPIAKAIGGGLPLGVLLARGDHADVFEKGTHGSTFGGNPVACAAGLAVCDVVFDPDFLAAVGRKGCRIWGALDGLKEQYPSLVEGVRGMGLMLGMVLKVPGMDLVEIGRREGLLFNCTAERVIRLLPPLTVSDEEIDDAVQRLDRAMAEFAKTR